VLTENGTTQQTRYYMDGYEYNVNGNEYIYYVPGGDGVCAIIQQCPSISAPTKDVHYIYTDHLGSIVAATDENGNLEAEQNFDAWGRFRNPATWGYNVPSHAAGIKAWLYRGYTGHEHMPDFSLINMNGRVYDPLLGRMLSPDNYVQSPGYSQSYNRFTYCLNNPLKYVDPSGDKWWHFAVADILTGGGLSLAAATTATIGFSAFAPFATDQGYEVQKYFSPIAFKLDAGIGSHQNGIGFDMSVGFLKGSGYRYHFGFSYNLGNNGGPSGWETREGGEVSLPGMSYSGTTFRNGDQTQTTNVITLGSLLGSMSYENDTEMPFDWIPGVPAYDGGDRYRTAAFRIRVGIAETGMLLHTGDPATNPRTGWYQYSGGTPNVFQGNSIDDLSQRAGILYMGVGPLRIGWDAEGIRHFFQNQFAHDFINGGSQGSNYPWVKTFKGVHKFYWFFGSSNGNTLW